MPAMSWRMSAASTASTRPSRFVSAFCSHESATMRRTSNCKIRVASIASTVPSQLASPRTPNGGGVGVGVRVGVREGVGVLVGVSVLFGMSVGVVDDVGVGVPVGVSVIVDVGVLVGVDAGALVGVGVLLGVLVGDFSLQVAFAQCSTLRSSLVQS